MCTVTLHGARIRRGAWCAGGGRRIEPGKSATEFQKGVFERFSLNVFHIIYFGIKICCRYISKTLSGGIGSILARTVLKKKIQPQPTAFRLPLFGALQVPAQAASGNTLH